MKTRRRSALVAGALVLSLGLNTLTTSAASAAGLPGRAQRAGDYLASQLIHKTINATDTAYVAYSGTTPNLSLTAEAILAFHALGRTTEENLLLGYLEARVEKYVHVTSGCGSATAYDDAGHLGLVLYLANLTGAQSSFDLSALQARLLATQRPGGLFGLNSPMACYDGVQRTAFAILGLIKNGMLPTDPVIVSATNWIEHQQCPNGAFPAFRGTTQPCASSGWGANRFDTNSTADALLGLKASGADPTTGSSARALTWLASAQKADGTWGFYKNDQGDSDSTSAVITALVMAGQLEAGTIAQWTKSGVTPYQALATFQSKLSYGIVWQAGSLPDNLSTIEAILGLSGYSLQL